MRTKEVEMRCARSIALTVLAALVLTASVAADSASAVPTTLCKTGTYSPYCKTEDRYPEGTAFEATSSEVKLTASVLFVPIPISCESAMAGKFGKSGEPMSVTVTSWTLSGCHVTESTIACTASPVESGPYAGTLAWTEYWNGNLAVGTGSESPPGWTVSCPTEGNTTGVENCTFTFRPTLTMKGGNPPTVSASKQSMGVSAGKGCEAQSATFKGTYTMTAPTIAFVARQESPPTPTTGLCKKVEVCEAPNLYPAKTELKAESGEVTFTMPKEFAWGNVKCSESAITAKSKEAYGEPLALETTQFSLGKCRLFNGTGEDCTVTSVTMWQGSLARTPETANGKWQGSGTWSLQCLGNGLNCSMLTTKGASMTIRGGNPAKLEVNNVGVEVKCEGRETVFGSLVGTYTFTSPSAFYVEDVVR
jgi:hypothetical protein